MAADRDLTDSWNGDEGNHWVRNADRHDAMLEPLSRLLFDRVDLRADENVLDIGCGCGSTTLHAARLVGPNGTALGLDISQPMVDIAIARATETDTSNARFDVADAQRTNMATSTFDATISRIGVMFFDDPIAAFANIARTTRPGGRLVMVTWRALEHQQWLMVPGVAIAEHVSLPEVSAGSAGPFALSDETRVREILGRAGHSEIDVTPVETSILVGGPGSVDDTVEFLATGGIGRAVLNGATPQQHRSALAAMHEAMRPFHDGTGVRLGASVWVTSTLVP
jgi:SAM-dependent methyltransferase